MMIGSPVLAAIVSYWIFWILLAFGCGVRELTLRSAALFFALWVAGRVGLQYIPWEPAHVLFSPYVAVLDVALVFTIFKGDVRTS